MPRYTLQDKFGRKVTLEGDTPPTETDLDQIFSTLPPPVQKQPSLSSKAYDALAVPEKMSRKGLGQLAQMVPSAEPTGNMARDIALNTPKILAETVAESAPQFISRGSILTAGALKGVKAAAPALKAIGRGVARGAESISGLEYKTPGVLKEAFKNPKLILGPGKAKAEYEAAKATGGAVRKSLSKIPEKISVVKKSLKIAEKGKLNATEALEARKELAAIKKTVTNEFFRKSTEIFNKVAKPVFGEADKAYQQGVKSDALRMLLPVNKGGGTSIAKSALGSIAGMGPLVAMSPLAQGAAASALGATAKAAAPLVNNALNVGAIVPPAIEAAKVLTEKLAKKYLRKAKGDKDKARDMAIEDGYEIPE